MGASPRLPERFEPIRLLGEGGAGSVWLCRDSRNAGCLVALKVATASEATNLRHEYSTLSTLVHPSIPAVYGFQKLDGQRCCFALEYIDGSTFTETSAVKNTRNFVGLATEALHALAFIHDFGLIHRDLKPENLLVRRHPVAGKQVVLLDFGLAEMRRSGSTEVAGTLRFMAPELFHGSPPSVKADLFAMGMLFVAAVLGRHPISVDPTVDLKGYLESLRTPLNSVTRPSGFSSEVMDWLAKLCSYEPHNRPSDAREALAELRAVFGTDVNLEDSTTRTALVASGDPPGRQHEIERILSELANDDITAVFILGEAGMGKTRLLNAVRARVVRDGWLLTGVRELVPEHGVASEEPKTLVLLDELERIDPESSFILDSCVRRTANGRLKILAAGRLEEVSDPRVRALLSDSELLPTATTVELAPLDERAVAEVLQRATGGVPHEREVSRLLIASRGLPAVLEMLVTSGGPTTDGAHRLRESIEGRIRQLSPPALEALTVLAVIGEPTESQLLEETVSAENLFAHLDELQSLRLVVRTNSSWELSSGLISDIVFDQAGPNRVQATTRRAIAGIEASRETDAAMLARLHRLLGDKERASHYAILAGRAAAKRNLPELAASWIAQAILDSPPGKDSYARLRWEHAQLAEEAENFFGAAKGYAAVLRCYTPEFPPKSIVLSLKARALVKSGRHKAATGTAEQARRSASNDQERYIADSVEAGAAIVGAATSRALTLLGPAISYLENTKEHRWVAEALHAQGLALEKEGRIEEADRAFGVSEEFAQQHGHVETLVNSLIAHVNLILRTDAATALHKLEWADELATRHGLRRQRMWILFGKGRIFEDTGAWDKALECTKLARQNALLALNRAQAASSQVTIAQLLIELGRPQQAEQHLRELLRDPSVGSTAVYADLTLIEALLHRDDPPQEQLLDTLSRLDDLEARPPIADWGLCLLWLEYQAEFGESPSSVRTQAFLDTLAQPGVPNRFTARGHLAWSKEQLRKKNREAALEACVRALEALEGRHHDLAAQVYLSMSKAHKLAGAHVESNLAFERAQEELQKAAELIEDEDLRGDFLSRPVFRELRTKKQTFADAEERLGALYDMVHALNSGGDPEDRLGVILDQALRVVRAERGLILLRSEGDDRYQVRYSRNLEQETIEEAAQFSRTAVLAAGKGESVLAVNAANDERLARMKSVSAYGITSLLCVPLRVREELVGAVYVDSRSDGALFQNEDLQFLEAFADHAALALENARDLRRLEQRREQLLSATKSRDHFGAIIGRSPAMQNVYDTIERVAGSHLPVLIQGESGTGKELVAREIFRQGLRKDGPFLSENCAAIAPELIESELFGHVKGAFTGADRDKAGLFEQADGGTLFLDEIGDMAPAMQARLLRVLQEGELRRVGDEVRRHVDVRLITATHRDLPSRVEEGKFREDLLYRLQVLVVQLPPLRERPLDVAPLVAHFLEKIARQRGRRPIEVRTEAMELFERYAWPGNVRQLENSLQRLALLADGGPIARATIEQDRTLASALIGQRGAPTLSLKKNEKDRVAEALERSGGNRVEAARLLGISRATIFRKIKRYGLD